MARGTVMSDNDIRRLKVGCVYQKRKYVVSLRLNGDWLRKSGLEYGDYVTVEIKDDSIIIKKFDL